MLPTKFTKLVRLIKVESEGVRLNETEVFAQVGSNDTAKGKSKGYADIPTWTIVEVAGLVAYVRVKTSHLIETVKFFTRELTPEYDTRLIVRTIG